MLQKICKYKQNKSNGDILWDIHQEKWIIIELGEGCNSSNTYKHILRISVCERMSVYD
jgi:hypothetical protein